MRPRDQSADAGRLSAIEQSILKAIADAEAERKGLARGTRDPKTEQLLQQAEEDLMAGQKRGNELAAHIGHMGRVLDFLKQK
jgi:hypothetical protein